METGAKITLNEDIFIYTTGSCPFCDQAKWFVGSEMMLDFIEVDLETNEEAKRELTENLSILSVPVVNVGDDYVVGYNQRKIKDLLKKHRKE